MIPLIALAVACIASLLWNGDEAYSPNSDVPAPLASPANAAPAIKGLVGQSKGRTRRDADGLSGELSLAAHEAAIDGPSVTGPLVLESLEGQALSVIGGSITWRVFDGPGATSRVFTSKVKSASWALNDIDISTAILPISAQIDSMGTSFIALPDNAKPKSINQLVGETLTFRCQPGTLLRVVDKVSGKDLEEFCIAPIFSTRSPFRATMVVPPSIFRSGPLTRTMKSPSYVSQRPGVITAWIGATNYKWQRIAFDVDVELVEVSLVKGASIEVVVEDPEQLTAYTTVYVFGCSKEGQLFDLATQPLAVVGVDNRSRILIDGLPEGEVRVALGKNARLPLSGPWLSLASGTLSSSRREVVQLNTKSGHEISGLASLEVNFNADLYSKGTRFFIEQQLDALESGLRITEPLVSDIPVLGEGLAKVDNLIPGEYIINVVPLGYSERVRLEPGKLTSIALNESARPSPCILRFEAPDHSPLRNIEVSARSLLSSNGGSWVKVGFTDQEGTIHFTFPEGDLAILAKGHAYMSEVYRVTHNVDGAIETIVAREAPDPTTARISFRRGSDAAMLPLEYLYSIDIAGINHEGSVLRTQGIDRQLGRLKVFASSGVDVALSGPGRYRMSFPTFPGAPRISSQVIELHRGTNEAILIDL